MTAPVKLQEMRGPKVGDAASLWNIAPAPGWTHEEVAVFKLCLQKYGVGCWQAIQRTGLLPGKLVQQMVGQAQRLHGQQSLAAFTGLHLDIDRIREDNALRTDVQRKAGLIIYTGPTATTEMKDSWRRSMQERYGLSAEMLSQASAALEEHAAAQLDTVGGEGLQGAAARTALIDMMGCDTSQLPPAVAAQLLCRLQTKLTVLVDRLRTRLGLTAAQHTEEVAGEGSTDVTAADGLGDATDAAGGTGGMPAVQSMPGLGRPPRPGKRGGKQAARQKGPGRACSLLRAAQGDPDHRASSSHETSSKKRRHAATVESSSQDVFLHSGSQQNVSHDQQLSQSDAQAVEGPARRSKRATTKAAWDAVVEADLASLQSMGFPRARAEVALLEAGGCVEAALDWLLTNAV